jgi:uncharacterized protein involved in exopolysaccharide biosynthesis
MKPVPTKNRKDNGTVPPDTLSESLATGTATDASSGGHKSPPEELNKFDPRRILGLIIAYWWLITLFALVGAAGGATYCVLGAPKFQAVCQYQIYVEKALDIGAQTTAEAQSRQLSRQITILQSSVLENRVKTKLAPKYKNQLRVIWTSR